MLEGIVTVILSAITAALGFMIVRWLTSVDRQLHELDKTNKILSDKLNKLRADIIGRKEFFDEIKDIRKSNEAHERRISAIENKISAITTDHNKITNFISAYVRKMVQKNDKTKQ